MNIYWHNQRFNSARSQLFGIDDVVNLRNYIQIPKAFNNGVVKCRISYNYVIHDVEFEKYQLRPILSLKAIHSDIIYDFKYKEREAINQLYALKDSCDDILIIKDGQVTDTSYGNVAFLAHGKWYVPDRPLLQGTRRMNLISKSKVTPISIRTNDLHRYSHISVFNALIPLGKITIPVSSILI